MTTDETGTTSNCDSERIECPECGSSSMVHENPILEDEYECASCVIAFNADGEVTARE